MDKLGVAVLGMGFQGQIFSRDLAFRIPEAKLVCVADTSMERARQVGIEGVELYDDYRKVLERKDVDAVIIATSTPTHEQVIKDVALAKKDIFCEKPICTTLEAIDRSLAIVKKSGVRFQVGFCRRFDPSFRRVREHVENGNIGDPRIINITSRDPRPQPFEYLKVSGGIFFDATVHDFDMARFLSGDEIIEVYATGSVLVDKRIGDIGDLDTTIAVLKFKNGAVGSINNCRSTGYSYDQRVEVFGSKGCAIAHNERPTRVEYSNPEGTHWDVPLRFNPERYPEAFYGEIKAFVKSIIDNAEVLVTGNDGRAATVLSIAATKSARENRPVKVSEVG